MNRFLKWVGLLNAAIWLGATLFFTFAVGPAFFSEKTWALFGWPQNVLAAKYYAGAVAQVVLERYFLMQHLCGSLALLHLFVSWIYTGRPLQRWLGGMVAGVVVIGFLGGFWIQPKLHELHQTMYGVGGRITVVQAEKARRSFGVWHGFSQAMNFAAMLGIAGYFWQLHRVESGTRFTTSTKFSWE